MNTTSNNKSPDKRDWGDSKNKAHDLWHTEQKLPENWGKQRNTVPASWSLTANSPDEWNNGAEHSINYDASSKKNIIKNASEEVSSVLNNANDNVTDSSEKSDNTFANRNAQSETASNEASFLNKQLPPLQSNIKQNFNDCFANRKVAAEYNSRVFEGENTETYYSPPKSNKKGIVIAIIGLISFFVIVPKIVDKSSSSDLKSGQPASDNNKIAAISEQETTAQATSTEAVTTVATESTTVTTLQTTVTTVTTTTTPAATAPPVDYKAAYTKTLEEYKQGLYYTSDDEYGIADVTGDGIPELFIIRINDVGRQADVYVYKNSAYQLVKLNGIILDEYYLKYEPELHLLQSFCEEGGRGRHVISLTSDGTATQIDEVVSDYGNAPCYRNDVSISLEEYNEAEKYYDSLGWQSITRYSFSNIQVDNNTQYYRNYNEYSIPNDFYIFPKSLSAKVNVQSGGLNLRAEPSTDSFVITLLPNATDLSVKASNGSWVYVEYTIHDPSISYYGYVSTDFIVYNQRQY